MFLLSLMVIHMHCCSYILQTGIQVARISHMFQLNNAYWHRGSVWTAKYLGSTDTVDSRTCAWLKLHQCIEHHPGCMLRSKTAVFVNSLMHSKYTVSVHCIWCQADWARGQPTMGVRTAFSHWSRYCLTSLISFPVTEIICIKVLSYPSAEFWFAPYCERDD